MEDVSIETIRNNLMALKEKANAITGNSNAGKRSPPQEKKSNSVPPVPQDEETLSMVYPRPASSLPTPTPHYMPSLNSESTSINSIIDRAQSLLHRVKNSRSHNDSKPFEVEMDETRKLLTYNDTHLASNNLLVTRKDFNPNVEYLDSDLTEIDLLLRGIPEAYDDEPDIDDEMVDNLLKVGGPPPSQLELPSLYASNQLVMQRLRSVVEIEISLQHLLVYSSKYGIRREGSYLLIRGPKCYPREDDLSQPRIIPLNELKKKDLLPISEKKDHLKNYFVGDVDIDKHISFPVRVDDRLVHDWLQGKNGIEIELYSYLAPPGSKSTKGALNSQVMFAKSVISMGGILGTKGLDAIINADFQVDVSNHSVVMSRMRAISLGQNVKPLSSKLGIVSLRVTLSDKNQLSSNGLITSPPETVFQQLADQEDNDHEDVSTKAKKFPVDDALQYLPTEVKYPPSTYVDDTDANIELKSFTKPHRAKKYFALALLNISHFQLSKTIIDSMRVNSAMLRVVYKFSLKDSDSMEVDLKSDPRLDQPGYVMNVALGKVNICHEISLKFPMIELWLEFPHGNMLQRKLIGRSKSSYFCEDGQAFNLSIYDIATLQEVVQVKMAYFWGEDGWKLEENVQHSLDSYAVNPDMSEAAPEEKTDHFDMNLRDSLDSQLSMDSLSNDNLLADISQIKENLVDLHYQPAFTTLPPMKTMAKSRQSFESTHSVEENDEDYIALLNPKKPQYGSQPEHIAKKTTKSVSTTSSNGAHVLDIALHGNCVLQEAGESQDLLPIMGCHVCYALPNIHDQDTTNARKLVISEGSLTESVSMFSVWWDAECAILNSTNRHRFESTIDQNNIASALGINPNVGIIYYLVDCDENGNLPKDILPFAKAVLGMDRLCEVLQSNVTEKLIKLPIQYLEDRHRHLVHAYLVLKFSHRCEPVLLNRSQDGKSILQEASREEKHEDKEPSVSANLHNSILPISSNQAKPHHVDFIVDVDQFSHLRLPNNSVKGNLFFSLSVVKDYKTNKLNQHVLFSELFPWEEQFPVETKYSLPCPLSSEKLIELDEDLLYNSAMKDVAKSSLVLNLYERLDLFPKKEDKNKVANQISTGSYPPLHVRATDKFVGSAVIDLSVLAIGMPYIEGWYNLLDELQHIIGQMKLKVVMREGGQNRLTGVRDILDTSTLASSGAADVSQTKTDEGQSEVESVVGNEVDTESVQSDEVKSEDVDYAIDESLIDIKAMEYENLRRLLGELEQTKERLLTGWLPSVNAAEETRPEDFSQSTSTGPSYESDFTFESVSAPQLSTPAKSTSDAENSMYSSNFSEYLSNSEDMRIERIMQVFDQVMEYKHLTSEDNEETAYSSDFESYTASSTRDHAQFEESTPNFTANLESPVRFPGGRIEWVVEADDSISHSQVSVSDYQSFSTEMNSSEFKQQNSSRSTMLTDTKEDSHVSVLSTKSEELSHVDDFSREESSQDQKESDVYFPAPTPEWKRTDTKNDENDHKQHDDEDFPFKDESKDSVAYEDHLEYLEECSESIENIELSPMSQHEDSNESIGLIDQNEDKASTQGISQESEEKQPSEAFITDVDLKQCKDEKQTVNNLDRDVKVDTTSEHGDASDSDDMTNYSSMQQSIISEGVQDAIKSNNENSQLIHDAEASLLSEELPASVNTSTSSKASHSRTSTSTNEEYYQQKDSPMTSKIRALVNEEVDRLFENKYHPVSAVPPLQQSMPPSSINADSRNNNPQMTHRMNLLSLDEIEKSLQEDAPVIPAVSSSVHTSSIPHLPSQSFAKSDADILQENLRHIQESLLASKRPHRQLARLPGRHKSFIDAETERVSKIMLGSLSHK